MKAQNLDLHHNYVCSKPLESPGYCERASYLGLSTEPTGQENNCFYRPDQTLSSSMLPPDLQ